MNTLSHVPSTASTLQYMQHHLYMPSTSSPVTTTTIPALPLDENTPILAIQHNNTYYPYVANYKLSAEEANMPLLSEPQNSAPSTAPPPMTELSKQEPRPSHPRKRTRATPEQLSVLEQTFSTTPTPNSRLREQLSRDLKMPERSIQIWFQNRRAKVKNMAKRSSVLHSETIHLQSYAAAAASAACQAATYHYQQIGAVEKTMATPDLYYYYYYYYYSQQVQSRQHFALSGAIAGTAVPITTTVTQNVPSPISPSSNFVPQSAPPPPPMMADVWSTPPPPPPPPALACQPHRRGLIKGVPSPTSISSSSNHLRAYSLDPYPQPCDGSVGTITATATMMGPLPASNHEQQQHRSRCFTSPAGYWPNLPYMRQQQQEYPSLAPQPPTPPLDEMLPATLFATTSTTTRFPVRALQIGSWGRMSMHPHDLVCHYDTQNRAIMWGIRNGPQQFKMEFNFDAILEMSLQPLSGEHLDWARLELRLAQPEVIMFYMKTPSSSTGANYWTRCSDFTQDNQAGTVHVHHLDGPGSSLRAALQRLLQSDPHLQSVFVDSSADTMSSGSCGRSDAGVQLFQGTHHHQVQG